MFFIVVCSKIVLDTVIVSRLSYSDLNKGTICLLLCLVLPGSNALSFSCCV